MADLTALSTALRDRFDNRLLSLTSAHNEITLECTAEHLLEIGQQLCHDKFFAFTTLIDCCGVDYLYYGCSEWPTESATAEGFSRAVDREHLERVFSWDKPRFAVVYHLLSTELNQRLRLRVFADGEPPKVPSVVALWPAANWFEREAFDFYGILFEGHPDLRRILTDYGFIGHPFRKDFPLSGNVEMRYDAKQQRVIYEPVDIQPRILVPKVIRDDSRYSTEQNPAKQKDATNA